MTWSYSHDIMYSLTSDPVILVRNFSHISLLLTILYCIFHYDSCYQKNMMLPEYSGYCHYSRLSNLNTIP